MTARPYTSSGNKGNRVSTADVKVFTMEDIAPQVIRRNEFQLTFNAGSVQRYSKLYRNGSWNC